MPTLEEILRRARFCHSSRYRQKPSPSSLHQNHSGDPSDALATPFVDRLRRDFHLHRFVIPGVGVNVGQPIRAHAVLLATNHKTVEVKVAPIECDLEQVMQRGDAAIAAHVQTPPNRRVDLEEQDVELVNFNPSV